MRYKTLGKSTLLNSLMKQPIAGVSAVRSTTVGRLTGVITFEDTQLVFLDTPGIVEWLFINIILVRKLAFYISDNI